MSTEHDCFESQATVFILENREWKERGSGLVKFVFDLKTYALILVNNPNTKNEFSCRLKPRIRSKGPRAYVIRAESDENNGDKMILAVRFEREKDSQGFRRFVERRPPPRHQSSKKSKNPMSNTPRKKHGNDQNDVMMKNRYNIINKNRYQTNNNYYRNNNNHSQHQNNNNSYSQHSLNNHIHNLPNKNSNNNNNNNNNNNSINNNSINNNKNNNKNNINIQNHKSTNAIILVELTVDNLSKLNRSYPPQRRNCKGILAEQIRYYMSKMTEY